MTDDRQCCSAGPLRAAIYARYSSERQAETSIDDQVRLCRVRAERESWAVVTVHTDSAISGSTEVATRAGGKALLVDVLAGRIDVLLLEGLDRLSRDQVEQERIVRRLEHRGVRIVGVSDGYDSALGARKVLRGVRGLINELYLDDLRAKTHRGQAGQVDRGFAAGGRSYGYRLVATEAGSRFEVDEAEARWVRWIFEQYAAGEGVHRIAYRLNELGVPAPRGGTWAVSAIYGSPVKGSGVLNNLMYGGRLVWNRSQWVRDPDTGQRRRIERPRGEWMDVERPELRIVDDATWRAVRARIDADRGADGRKRAVRPGTTLLGGLMHCPHCRGALIAINSRLYACITRKDRGPAVCRGFSIRRDVAERRLLAHVREELLSPEAATAFEQAFHAALHAATAHPLDEATQQRRAAELRGEIQRLVDGIAAVGPSPALAARLRQAERELESVERALAQLQQPATVPPVRRLFRETLLNLSSALQDSPQRARAVLAELLGPITIVLDGDQVWAEMQTARLAMTAAGRSISVVAGACFDRCSRVRLL